MQRQDQSPSHDVEAVLKAATQRESLTQKLKTKNAKLASLQKVDLVLKPPISIYE